MDVWLKSLKRSSVAPGLFCCFPCSPPFFQKWLEQKFFSDPSAVATTVFNNIVVLGQQRWFLFRVGLFDRIVIGVSLDWVTRKLQRKQSFQAPTPRF